MKKKTLNPLPPSSFLSSPLIDPLPPPTPSPQFVKGDIQSADLLNFVLEDEKVDTVMHFAAQTHVDNSFGNSLAFTLNNTHGTHVLLEACRVYGGVRRFIAVSTDEVYGESSVGREEGCNETSTLEPTNPYSAAKAGAEMMVKVREISEFFLRERDFEAFPSVSFSLFFSSSPALFSFFGLLSLLLLFFCLLWARLVRSFRKEGEQQQQQHDGEDREAAEERKQPRHGREKKRRNPQKPHPIPSHFRNGQNPKTNQKAYMTSYKMPCIITRGNNVYGPHQFPEKLIPKFTLLASRGAPLPVHGDGGATRSYLFVEDVAEAFETVLLKGKIGETYNIGTQKERTVLDVATVRERYSFFLLLIWFRTKKTVFSPPSSRKKKLNPKKINLSNSNHPNKTGHRRHLRRPRRPDRQRPRPRLQRPALLHLRQEAGRAGMDRAHQVGGRAAPHRRLVPQARLRGLLGARGRGERAEGAPRAPAREVKM